VAETTSSSEAPAASSTRRTLSSVWRACASMVSPASAPDAGSRGTCPETKTKPPARTAGVYGPLGGGSPAGRGTGSQARGREFGIGRVG
jgi:hypothetical protein